MTFPIAVTCCGSRNNMHAYVSVLNPWICQRIVPDATVSCTTSSSMRSHTIRISTSLAHKTPLPAAHKQRCCSIVDLTVNQTPPYCCDPHFLDMVAFFSLCNLERLPLMCSPTMTLGNRHLVRLFSPTTNDSGCLYRRCANKHVAICGQPHFPSGCEIWHRKVPKWPPV